LQLRLDFDNRALFERARYGSCVKLFGRRRKRKTHTHLDAVVALRTSSFRARSRWVVRGIFRAAGAIISD
jgi:hypothetical protein